jgi:nucleoid-associated protein YgaU
MPNDAKLGLVVGVGLVIVFAVAYSRRDVTYPTSQGPRTVQTVSREANDREQGRRGVKGMPVPGPLIGVNGMLAPRNSRNKSHTVQDGETLFSLARQYYGAGEKSTALYRANRDRVRGPDRIPPGTVLVIPDENDPSMKDEE